MQRVQQIILAAVAVSSLASAACTAKSNDSIETAQIAVRANPALELVATDEKQGVLTVKVKRTGQIMTVKATDVTAGTAFKDLDTQAAAPAPAAGTSSATGGSASATTSTTPSGRTTAATGAPPRTSVQQTAAGTVVAAGSARVSTTPDGKVGVSARGPAGQSATVQTPSASASSDAPPASSATQPPAAAARAESGANLDESRLRHRSDPVVCVNTSVALDGVSLRTAGVAIQGVGCRAIIRNSHIAGAVALQLAGNSEATIENSIIEGQAMSVQLSDGSVASIQQSTMHGSSQRVSGGRVKDLGGNVWR